MGYEGGGVSHHRCETGVREGSQCSLARYQFCVMFSVETTTQRQLRCSWAESSFAARSTAITEAEQPIPPRLYCAQQRSNLRVSAPVVV
jgi:hypothetical protein